MDRRREPLTAPGACERLPLPDTRTGARRPDHCAASRARSTLSAASYQDPFPRERHPSRSTHWKVRRPGAASTGCGGANMQGRRRLLLRRPPLHATGRHRVRQCAPEPRGSA
eukprot:1963677-Prymnesium_polylepis.2